MDHLDPDETTKLINAAGGDAEFAKLLGIDGKPGYRQRVNNWKRRGIPPAVVLEHYSRLQSLSSKRPRVHNAA